MKIRYHLLVIMLLSATLFSHGSIHYIDHITDIMKFIRNGPTTLICFDVDETLLYPEEPEARDAFFEEHVALLKKKGASVDSAVKETITRQITAHKKTDVCQADWDQDELVAALQKKGVHVVCLTARSIAFVDITYRQLNKTLINLKTAPGWDRCYIFKKNLPSPAHYVPGILFASGNNKGDVLEQLLNQLNFVPAHLIMVDDTPKHVERVGAMAKRRNIPYDGFVIKHTYHKRLPCVTLQDGVSSHP